MSERILFNQNLGNLEWTGTSQKKSTLPSSSLIIPDPLLDASKYYFMIDDAIYTCTGVSDTSSYLTFRYDIEGTNVLYVRLVKNSDTVDISIRPASFPDISFETSVLKLIEEQVPVLEGEYNAIIRFNRWLAVEVNFNTSTKEYAYDSIISGEIPETEFKTVKTAIIRFTKDNAVKVIYNETTGSISIVEVE